MSRPLSQLLYHRIQEGTGTPRIITLHGHNQMGDDVKDLGMQAAPDGRVISLESYKGVFVGREIVGYTWFIGPLNTPSPLFFGDALAEIEKFLWDEIDRQGTAEAELPFLIGPEQGGIMALAAALAVPDLLSGVIAIDAFLPIVPGWEPPLAPLEGLPILLVEHSPSAEPAGVLAGQRLADQLTEWGATVTRLVGSQAGEEKLDLSTWTRLQPTRQISVDPVAT